jgi:hypothetical protein
MLSQAMSGAAARARRRPLETAGDVKPMSYFHLYDDATVTDNEGTDLINLSAARDHAAGAARELTFKSSGMMDQGWSKWAMRVHDEHGKELFSLALSDYARGNS